MKKLLALMFVFIFCLGFTAALDLGTFKKSSCVELLQFGANTTTYSNLSYVTYPNSSFSLLGEYTMSKNGTTYNYTFCDTNTTGFYKYGTHYDNSGVDTISQTPYTFQITDSGHIQTTAQGINSAIYLILMIFLTIFFGFVGFKLSETETLWILGLFFIFLALLFVTYDSWLGIEYYTNYIGLDNSSNMPQIIFYIYLSLLGSGLLVSAVLLFKKIPEIIDWFRREVLGQKGDGFNSGDDGYDGGR